jgi:ABC-type nitrate/sulfonate/bicarbonate transport system substrate-binding protein
MKWKQLLQGSLIAACVAGWSSAAIQAQELKKVRMGYPAFSLTFLTFFVAKDAGIYKKHGLDVEMVQLAGAVQTSALVAGEIDYLTGITGHSWPRRAACRSRASLSPTIARFFG